MAPVYVVNSWNELVPVNFSDPVETARIYHSLPTHSEDAISADFWIEKFLKFQERLKHLLDLGEDVEGLRP